MYSIARNNLWIVKQNRYQDIGRNYLWKKEIKFEGTFLLTTSFITSKPMSLAPLKLLFITLTAYGTWETIKFKKNMQNLVIHLKFQ